VFSSEKKIAGLSFFVDGTVVVFLLSIDLDIGVIHSPAAANRVFIFSEYFSIKGKNRINQRWMEEW